MCVCVSHVKCVMCIYVLCMWAIESECRICLPSFAALRFAQILCISTWFPISVCAKLSISQYLMVTYTYHFNTIRVHTISSHWKILFSDFQLFLSALRYYYRQSQHKCTLVLLFPPILFGINKKKNATSEAYLLPTISEECTEGFLFSHSLGLNLSANFIISRANDLLRTPSSEKIERWSHSQ